jgi:hypothetical protein
MQKHQPNLEAFDRVDWMVMSDMLVTGLDWTEVFILRPLTRNESDAILKWIPDNCEGRVKSRDWHFVFERKEDAVLFKLRWGE